MVFVFFLGKYKYIYYYYYYIKIIYKCKKDFTTRIDVATCALLSSAIFSKTRQDNKIFDFAFSVANFMGNNSPFIE